MTATVQAVGVSDFIAYRRARRIECLCGVTDCAVLLRRETRGGGSVVRGLNIKLHVCRLIALAVATVRQVRQPRRDHALLARLDRRLFLIDRSLTPAGAYPGEASENNPSDLMAQSHPAKPRSMVVVLARARPFSPGPFHALGSKASA